MTPPTSPEVEPDEDVKMTVDESERPQNVFEKRPEQDFPQASAYLETHEIFVVQKNTDRETILSNEAHSLKPLLNDGANFGDDTPQTEPLCLTVVRMKNWQT